VDLSKWAKAKDVDPAEARALARLGELPPSDKPGRVLVPFPVGDDSPYDKVIGHKGLHKRIEAAPVKKVPIGTLVTNGQKSVRVDQTAHYVSNKGEKGTKHGTADTAYPIVVRVGGKNVVMDGHHRATAAWLRGEPRVEAKYVDLDVKPKKIAEE
jgi:hypothetical protein